MITSDPAIPEHVKRATLAGLEDGTSAHYTMPIGNMELKMELAKKLKAFNHLDVDPERNIIITPGSDAGLMFAMMPFIDPGDEVMVPDPSYPNNFLNARILGGVTVPVPLREDFRLDKMGISPCIHDRFRTLLQILV